jgi:predicted molibdopterin-dependent oxidoreductase YjgC
VAVYNIDSLRENAAQDLKALANLLLLTGKIGKAGNGLILLREHCNSQGLLDMGIGSNCLPGYEPYSPQSLSKYEQRWQTDLSHVLNGAKKDVRSRIEAGEIRACLILGENPLKEPRNHRYLDPVEFLAVQDLYVTETAARADVVLPLSLITESTGTFTNCERRIQRFSRVFRARSGLENWQMICRLAESLGASFAYASPEEVFHEMVEVVPFLDISEPPTAGAKGVCWHLGGRANGEEFLFAEGFPLPGGKARFQPIEPEQGIPEYYPAPYCVTDERLAVFRERNLMRAGEY